MLSGKKKRECARPEERVGRDAPTGVGADDGQRAGPLRRAFTGPGKDKRQAGKASLGAAGNGAHEGKTKPEGREPLSETAGPLGPGNGAVPSLGF